MVGVRQQVTSYRVSYADINVVKLRCCSGLDKVTLGVGGRCSRGVCALICTNLLRNCQVTAAVKGKDFVCPCRSADSELRRSDCICFRNLDGAVKLFLYFLCQECQLVQRLFMRFSREWVVRSIVGSLCQRRIAKQHDSLAAGWRCDEGNVATIGVADIRYAVVRSLCLDSFGTSSVVTKNDLDVIVVKDFEAIGKNGSGAVTAITVFSGGATDCHLSLLQYLIQQNLCN